MDAEIQAIVDDAKKKIVAKGVEVIEEILIDALPQILEAAAKKSATPIDDLLVAALKEPAKNALKDYLAKIKA